MGSFNRHKHVSPSNGLRGRRAARGAVVLLALSLAASVTVTGSASAIDGAARGGLSDAADDPQRVLQSVSVGVGPDGTITGIDSTRISKTDSSDLSTEDESFDPTQAAGDLPVRILTSYRLGDRSGTDLSEIAGESGRVVVEVVVQNTTVRPQRLTYDVGSTQRSQFALVGAPLTVVATAGLGAEGLTRVVTDDGGRDAGSEVTNGVLSRTEDDQIAVQWASLLAPPRLSPSTTFRLVQETESFEVPSFDINVQPGLVTDTSVQALLQAAFSDDASSTLQLEGRTIELIGQVTGALEIASQGLSDVEQLLDTSAQTIGQRTIADLNASSDSITTELRSLAGDLEQLNSDIDTQLERTRSSTLSQLDSTVETIKSRLGDPATTAPPAPVKVSQCAFDFPDQLFGENATVFAQLLRVQSQLTAIGEASRVCADDLAEELRTAIGSTDPDFVCTPDSEALICALAATRDGIVDKAVDLSTVGTDVAERFESNRLEELRLSVRDVNGTLADLKSTADDLVDAADSDPDSVGEILGSLLSGLQGLGPALDPGNANSIPSNLQSINDQARVALGALGTSSGADSVADQAQAAADAACALPAPVPGPDPVVADGRDDVSILLTGTTCSGAEAEVPGAYDGLSVADRAEAALAAVTEIEELSADDGDIADALDDLTPNVGELISVVLGVIGGSGADLQAAVDSLSERLDDLGSGLDDLPTGTACPTAGPDDEDAQTALNRSFGLLYCKQAGLDTFIENGFDEADAVLGQVGLDLRQGQLDANAARVDARNAVDGTTAGLNKRLKRAGNALRTKGAREIAAQRRRLDAEVDTVTRLLGQNITEAVTLIDTRVRTANGNLEESQRRLVADLARVLTDIGEGRRDGAGLLGALASGASETRLSNESIVRVSNTADAFRNLRSAAMEDTLLQQAQLTRSLELQQELPVFGLELPAGSRYVSVFSFHLGEE